jgi:hypothetical protein
MILVASLERFIRSKEIANRPADRKRCLNCATCSSNS